MFDIKEELKKLPDKPGVYIMKDVNNNIIYIGKAVVLKNRVRQYFQNSKNHTPKVKRMVSNIVSFEYIITDSELEALILECNLIKKHKPKYNILLKDDKHYPYIKITMNEEFPRILIVRKIEKDGAKYFGPYTNSWAVNETVNTLKGLFPIKSCNKVFPRDIGKSRPCLNYYINKCLGPCQGGVNSENYRDMMKQIVSFLNGHHLDVIKELNIEMQNAAENLQFELAASLRDRIDSIKKVAEKQKIISSAMQDEDVIAFAADREKTCVQVFFIRGGKLIGREYFILHETDKPQNISSKKTDNEINKEINNETNTDADNKTDNGTGNEIFEKGTDASSNPDSEQEAKLATNKEEIMTSFIKQFYSQTEFVPKEIVLQNNIDEASIIESWLSNKRGSKVTLKVPQKGEKKELIEMVAKNAAIALNNLAETVDEKSKKGAEAMNELLELINFEDTIWGQNSKDELREISRIEAYDISHIAGFDSVGSMVTFENGVPLKNYYRRFKIKSVVGANDYESMKEVLTRRFEHGIKENSEENKQETGDKKDNVGKTKFGIFPDIIMMDGGVIQVNAAKEVLGSLNLNIPVIGLVKDNSHKTRGVIFEGAEYNIPIDNKVYRMLFSIQEEVHRFAIDYHRNLRTKGMTKSVLDKIEGIGVKRRNNLLKVFGSVERIRNADIEKLAKVDGMNAKLAEKVYNFFRDI